MKKKLVRIIVACVLFIIALIIPFKNFVNFTMFGRIFSGELINNVIYVISYILVGKEIVLKAIKNIFRGKVFDENFLMTIATMGAFIIKEFPEAVGVMLFYQIGELFQSYAVDKSRKSISSLMDLRPDYANISKDGKVIKVDPDEIKIGDEIIVKPGEKIPLDGFVIEGEALIDVSALTGESVPQKIEKGEEVLSGSINKNGVLKIKTTKGFDESTVNKILELVENATSKKSKSENFISIFARYYTPVVVILAVLLAIIPPIFVGWNEFMNWFYRALTFLVVSCPCALVISIPLGFFGGIGGASKIGILIKGSNYLEALAKTEIVVFDKTGTLTKGVFEVQKIEAENEEELLEKAAIIESFSSHPIAVSIKEKYGKEIDQSKVNNLKEISGYGISAEISGEKIIIGNDKFMKMNKIEFVECEEIGTVVYMAIDNKYAGYILISDMIKEDSAKTIKDLKKNSIKKIVMLTGDRKKVGEYISKKLEIDEVYTELLPNDKAEKIEELLKQKTDKGKLVFAGDGINDAPVLALSDIGVAMGGIGSDAAIEAADVVIMTDEPSKIVNAINISKRTMKIVKENIIFALIIKIGVLALSAVGLSTMWEAVFADVGVSVLAILNSLRMLKAV